MNILITGSSGYVASALKDLLANTEHRVYCADTSFGADCCSYRDMIHFFNQKLDAVIHLAGVVGAPACKAHKYANILDNYSALEVITSLCESFGVGRFIYPSSCSVYGNVDGMYDTVDEHTPLLPLTEYAVMKANAEKQIKNKLPDSSIILRLTTVYGYAPVFRDDLVTNMFIRQAMAGQPITVDGGNQVRALIHVYDVAQAILATLDGPEFLYPYGPYIVGHPTGNISVKGLAELIAEETGVDIVTNPTSTDNRSYHIAPNKFMNAFNWNPNFDTRQGIKHTISRLKTEKPRFKTVMGEYNR